MAGMVVTRPSHGPANAFNEAKDVCALDWANAAVAKERRAMERIQRSDFIVGFS
jgi:hypothetical protein